MSSIMDALKQTRTTSSKKENVGIYNNTNVTDIRMEQTTGRLQYSLDHGKTWHNSKEKWLNFFVSPMDSSGGSTESGLGELTFSTHLEFPNLGDQNTLYIATDENVIYRWDPKKMIYVSLNSVIDINDIQVIQGII